MPSDAQIRTDALSIIKQAEKLPSLVVFDLDYTIWPFWCEVKTTRSQPRLYPEVRGIFEALKEAGIPMAVASRTPSPNIATVFLGKLQLTSLFAQQEIYPTFTHKTEHFKALLQGTKVPYEDMLFFDDEDRNVDTISPMGVKCVLVEDGVNLSALREGLAKFQKSRKRPAA
ncbi:Haloacid dehalogenase-like hydrolase (HAD) superfamily protein [Klebsormidium nitens]|uniref:Haloacid dehalogenase-like hydrolase (HAD) superfamily protein n=1 Tax=Klebsormidium nitens TaxID=105231 RepID=A0A1Y1HW93_KLENI|nr:Haloacid dehalogenase-like hydrolase (HAD) superfamily protein [Klebsormidium nitens]|eukprot:GAQ82904.1 Haloacid dehalogenase-like hydrolase (HAD) superfamily protein [Klebsormidium nitens]